MKLAYISNIISDKNINECIITTKVDNVFESYIGTYDTISEFKSYKGQLTVVSFANYICSIATNECQTMEETDLNHLLNILMAFNLLVPIKDGDEVDEKINYIIKKTINLIKNKKTVGIKASIDEKMKNCTIDILYGKKVHTFKGPLDITPTLGNNSIIFVNVYHNNFILSALIDDIFIDLTTELTYETAITEIHIISNILTNKKGWTGKIIALEF